MMSLMMSHTSKGIYDVTDDVTDDVITPTPLCYISCNPQVSLLKHKLFFGMSTASSPFL